MYGVRDHVEYLCGDCYHVLRHLEREGGARDSTGGLTAGDLVDGENCGEATVVEEGRPTEAGMESLTGQSSTEGTSPERSRAPVLEDTEMYLPRQRHSRVSSNLPLDIIILAPPWGGPSYTEEESFDIQTMISSGDGLVLGQLGLRCAHNVVYILPKHTLRWQLRAIAARGSVSLLIEDIYLHGKLKLLVAYFGPLFDDD